MVALHSQLLSFLPLSFPPVPFSLLTSPFSSFRSPPPAPYLLRDY